MSQPDEVQSKLAELQSQVDATSAASREAKKLMKKLFVGATTADEKLTKLQGEFVKLFNEDQKHQKEISSLTFKIDLFNKERVVEKEHLAKLEQTNSTLKELCSLLQKREKDAMEAVRLSEEAEQKRRQETIEKFHENIKDIQAKIDAQMQEKEKTDKENATLQLQVRKAEAKEQLQEAQIKAKEAELQLATAKLQEVMQFATTAAAKADDREKLCQELRAQLQEYSEKFQSLEGTMKQSQTMLLEFKKEITKSSTLIKKMEKEKAELTQRVNKADLALVQTLEERETMKQQVVVATQRLEQLQSLCRELQKQNTELRKSQASDSVSPSTETAPGA